MPHSSLEEFQDLHGAQFAQVLKLADTQQRPIFHGRARHIIRHRRVPPAHIGLCAAQLIVERQRQCLGLGSAPI